MKRLTSIGAAIVLTLSGLAGVTASPAIAADNCSKMSDFMENKPGLDDFWGETNQQVVMRLGPGTTVFFWDWKESHAKLLKWSKNSETKSLLKALASKVKRGADDIWDVYYKIQDNIDYGKC